MSFWANREGYQCHGCYIWVYSVVGRQRGGCQWKINLGRGKASLFVKSGWGWDNAYRKINKETRGSRSYKQGQSKRIEGGKQGASYWRGWKVDRGWDEEDDL